MLNRPSVASRARPRVAGRHRLMTCVGLTVVVAALCAAGLAPAMATRAGPSMTVNRNDVILAVQGSRHSLIFYWAFHGTKAWHPETVAGQGTTFSAPSMTVDGNSVNITAMGPDHSLRFYRQVTGTGIWHSETVAGKGTTFSAPSMIAMSGGEMGHSNVFIAATGAQNRLKIYSDDNGTTTWRPETVAGRGTTYSAPTVASVSDAVYIAAMGAQNQLDFYNSSASTPQTWVADTVAGPGTTFSAPSMIENPDLDPYIAVMGAGHQLTMYWSFTVYSTSATTWLSEPVAVIRPATKISAPVLSEYQGNFNITAVGPEHSLMDYSGFGRSWTPGPVGATFSALSVPSITVYGKSIFIAVVGPKDRLKVYWNPLDWAAYGLYTWHRKTVGGIGSVR
jgi:hypothetical protein